MLDTVGAGGMGTVFKGCHRRMKCIVAPKLLSSRLAKNASFVQRFLREVEMIAASPTRTSWWPTMPTRQRWVTFC